MIIHYNRKTRKFEIECNFVENALIADLPNKRFQKHRRLWQAPAFSRNSEFLLARFKDDMTPEALSAAEHSISRKEIKRRPFPGWYDFKTEPFKHQMQALDYVWGLDKYALFMEMGTGKTKIAIDLNSAHLMSGRAQVWVIFCPNAVRHNWADEISTHCPMWGVPVHIADTTTKAKRNRLLAAADSTDPFIVVVGIESMQVQHRGGHSYTTLMEMVGDKKTLMTVDESHLIKNPEANRSKNIQEFAEFAEVCGVMTGSPIAQGILDLYQQFNILDPDIIGIGNYYSFRSRYAEMGGYENREVVGYKNVDELMDLIRPYVFQCTKEEALDLPDKLYSRRVVQMTKEQARVYRELNRDTESLIKDLSQNGKSIELIVDQVLQKYNALQQVTGGFVNYNDETGEEVIRRSAWIVDPERNPKVRELMAIAEENPGKCMIIWAKFRNEIQIICEALRHKYGPDSVVEYHGGISVDQRRANLDAFKRGTSTFFVANQQTGGTGLTINEANLVVYFSNSLKLVDRLQSEDRCHRIGQDANVTYVDLACEGTKDINIMSALRDKKDIADYVRDSIKQDT